MVNSAITDLLPIWKCSTVAEVSSAVVFSLSGKIFNKHTESKQNFSCAQELNTLPY